LVLNIPEEVSIIAPGEVLGLFNALHTSGYHNVYEYHIFGALMRTQMRSNRLTHYPEEEHTLKVKPQLIRRGSCKKKSYNPQESILKPIRKIL